MTSVLGTGLIIRPLRCASPSAAVSSSLLSRPRMTELGRMRVPSLDIVDCLLDKRREAAEVLRGGACWTGSGSVRRSCEKLEVPFDIVVSLKAGLDVFDADGSVIRLKMLFLFDTNPSSRGGWPSTDRSDIS